MSKQSTLESSPCQEKSCPGPHSGALDRLSPHDLWLSDEFVARCVKLGDVPSWAIEEIKMAVHDLLTHGLIGEWSLESILMTLDQPYSQWINIRAVFLHERRMTKETFKSEQERFQYSLNRLESRLEQAFTHAGLAKRKPATAGVQR